MSNEASSAEHVWTVDDYISYGPPAFDQYGMVVGVDVERRMLRVKIGVTDADVAEMPFQDAKFIRHQSKKPDRRRRPAKRLFERGDMVRVIAGAFVSFQGMVEEVDEERERLRVAVMVQGRKMPQDLAFSDVEKV